MDLQFFGASGTVTGSQTLVRSEANRIMVDCGLFQGFKRNRMRNWDPVDTGPLDAVLLTHAHLDHSGRVPRLVREGYDGPVFCTPGTADLLQILWPDAGRIQEEDARHANRRGSTRHRPALPLFTEEDAHRALRRLQTVAWGETLGIGNVEVRFQEAGHILGASGIELRDATSSVYFSGDIGRLDDAMMRPPQPPPDVQMVVMESTYGNRLHPRSDDGCARWDLLADVIRRTAARGGMVLIPSFAVGRTQGLLWALHRLKEQRAIPDLPIVVDSPMATRATTSFLAHPDDLSLTAEQLEAMTRDVLFTASVEESKALASRDQPFVLLAASGMLTGGRVLHHLRRRGPDVQNTLLFVGFQAPGTRGGRIVDGERTVRMHGRDVELRCEVVEIGGFSAHADQDELITWLESAGHRPDTVLLNHGEPASADALRRRLKERGQLTWVAAEGERWDVQHGRRTVLSPPVDDPLENAALFFDRDDTRTREAVRRVLERMAEGSVRRRPVFIRGPLLDHLRSDLPDALLVNVRDAGW